VDTVIDILQYYHNICLEVSGNITRMQDSLTSDKELIPGPLKNNHAIATFENINTCVI
jgi:hypothetical protein